MSQEQEESKKPKEIEAPLGRFVRLQAHKNGVIELMRLDDSALMLRVVEKVDSRVVLLSHFEVGEGYKIWAIDTEWWTITREGSPITEDADLVLEDWGGTISFNVETQSITLEPKEEVESGDTAT